MDSLRIEFGVFMSGDGPHEASKLAAEKETALLSPRARRHQRPPGSAYVGRPETIETSRCISTCCATPTHPLAHLLGAYPCWDAAGELPPIARTKPTCRAAVAAPGRG